MLYKGETGEVSVISKGNECDAEWKINFVNLSEEVGAYYWSPDFSFKGEFWYLGIWPNGSKSKDSVGFIDMRLRIRTSGPPINVEFSFALKTVKGQKELEKYSTGVFKKDDLHGIYRFMHRSQLVRRKAEFLSSGFFRVICTLKILNYMGSASDSPAAECSFIKRSTDADNSPRKKNCMNKSIKCPECSITIDLQNWYESQTPSAKDDSSLCEDLNEMLLNGINHDLILKVGDKELRAHQDILRARSEVFKSMLTHDMKEKKSGIIDMPDCDPQAMEHFLSYIYTGKVDAHEQSNMLKLYYIADKYDKKGLKGKCRDFIKKSFTVNNICEVIQLALNHTDSDLLEHATEFFKVNALDIMHTVEWQTFMKDNSTAANELLIKSFDNLKNKNT